jgi:hypothetical protein
MVEDPKDKALKGKIGTGGTAGNAGNAGTAGNAGNAGNAAQLAHEEKEVKVLLPPPSPAHRAAMAQNISNSLAPPPRAIAQREMQRTGQGSGTQTKEQEQSIEIELGDGQVSSRRNPLSESGQYVGKMPAQERNEPVVLKPQARALSASAARLIAKRRAMMEGQDQAGSFKLPGSNKGAAPTDLS